MTDSRSQRRVYVQTWGCQMNEYDSDKMAEVLGASHDMQRVETAEEADVILLNTCSVREKAQEKVFSQLGRWKKLKDKNPDIVIGVGGCVASQEGDSIRDRAPYVDMVFGPQTLHRLPKMLDKTREDHRAVVDVSFPEIEKFDRLPEPRADGPVAFVSIMEGCSKYCTFCVVPYTRGEEISRPFDDVLVEVAKLAEQGVREVTLLGQNVNAYQGPMNDGGSADLALLIEYIAALDGIERVRYTTSHPVEFSDRLIEAYGENPKLVSHLHLPVQSGSDRILNLMKRGHTVADYLDKIRRLRELRPDISLSTDLIVGFPGETEDDFKATMDLVAEVGFDHSFSFVYSARPGTPAASIDDDTPLALKKERLQILQTRLSQSAWRVGRRMVDTVVPVLVEREARKGVGQMAGRTPHNWWVNFDGAPDLVGQFVNVKITDALPNSLRGSMLASAEAV